MNRIRRRVLGNLLRPISSYSLFQPESERLAFKLWFGLFKPKPADTNYENQQNESECEANSTSNEDHDTP